MSYTPQTQITSDLKYLLERELGVGVLVNDVRRVGNHTLSVVHRSGQEFLISVVPVPDHKEAK